MLERHLDTQEAPTKWWAAQDARMKNLVNKSHYSERTHIRVERMIQALGLCYNAKGIHEAFGKTGVSIKVDCPTAIKDRKNLRLLEQDWEAAGVNKKTSAQGIIYRFSAD